MTTTVTRMVRAGLGLHHIFCGNQNHLVSQRACDSKRWMQPGWVSDVDWVGLSRFGKVGGVTNPSHELLFCLRPDATAEYEEIPKQLIL